MAKKKIKFELKQDVLAMCNNKIRKRLFKMPIGVKPKEYFFTAKVDIEVEDPEWDKKAVERSLMLNIKRSMQLLSVRATTLLENLDKEKPADFKQEIKLIGKLKKTLMTYGKEVTDQAEYNLGQIIDDITKDVAKWGKAGETLSAMKAVDKGGKDLARTVDSLKESLIDTVEKIDDSIGASASAKLRKLEKVRARDFASVERRRKDEVNDYNLQEDDAGKKTNIAKINKKFAREKVEKQEIFEDGAEEITENTIKEVNGFVKEANTAFATYRKDRGDFNSILKDTAKKMHKMVDSKSKDNKAIAQLQDMLKKKVKPAAEAYGKNLGKCDKQIMDILKRLAGNKVSKKEITDAMPKPALGNALFKEFKDVKNHMKREKIQ